MGTRYNRLAEAVLTSAHNPCFEQKNEKISDFFYLKIFSFWRWNFLYIWIGVFFWWEYLCLSVRKRTSGHACPANIQISMHIRAVWSISPLGAFLIVQNVKFLHADNKNSDLTARMRRLILRSSSGAHVLGHNKTKQNDMCAQRRLRSAWAFAQSDQRLRRPHEESLGP